jgi:hypothetical protein
LADPCVDFGVVVIIVQWLLLVLVEEALSKLLLLLCGCCVCHCTVLVWCAQLECLGGC